VLADTRGYVSKDWERFVHVIYETVRLKPESEWTHMLRESGVGDNTTAVVISGERPEAAGLRTPSKRRRLRPATRSRGMTKRELVVKGCWRVGRSILIHHALDALAEIPRLTGNLACNAVAQPHKQLAAPTGHQQSPAAPSSVPAQPSSLRATRCRRISRGGRASQRF